MSFRRTERRPLLNNIKSSYEMNTRTCAIIGLLGAVVAIAALILGSISVASWNQDPITMENLKITGDFDLSMAQSVMDQSFFAPAEHMHVRRDNTHTTRNHLTEITLGLNPRKIFLTQMGFLVKIPTNLRRYRNKIYTIVSGVEEPHELVLDSSVNNPEADSNAGGPCALPLTGSAFWDKNNRFTRVVFDPKMKCEIVFEVVDCEIVSVQSAKGVRFCTDDKSECAEWIELKEGSKTGAPHSNLYVIGASDTAGGASTRLWYKLGADGSGTRPGLDLITARYAPPVSNKGTFANEYELAQYMAIFGNMRYKSVWDCADNADVCTVTDDPTIVDQTRQIVSCSRCNDWDYRVRESGDVINLAFPVMRSEHMGRHTVPVPVGQGAYVKFDLPGQLGMLEELLRLSKPNTPTNKLIGDQDRILFSSLTGNDWGRVLSLMVLQYGALGLAPVDQVFPQFPFPPTLNALGEGAYGAFRTAKINDIVNTVQDAYDLGARKILMLGAGSARGFAPSDIYFLNQFRDAFTTLKAIPSPPFPNTFPVFANLPGQVPGDYPLCQGGTELYPDPYSGPTTDVGNLQCHFSVVTKDFDLALNAAIDAQRTANWPGLEIEFVPLIRAFPDLFALTGKKPESNSFRRGYVKDDPFTNQRDIDAIESEHWPDCNPVNGAFGCALQTPFNTIPGLYQPVNINLATTTLKLIDGWMPRRFAILGRPMGFVDSADPPMLGGDNGASALFADRLHLTSALAARTAQKLFGSLYGSQGTLVSTNGLDDGERLGSNTLEALLAAEHPSLRRTPNNAHHKRTHTMRPVPSDEFDYHFTDVLHDFCAGVPQQGGNFSALCHYQAR